MLCQLLQDEILRIGKANLPTNFQIEIEFTSPKDSSFYYKPLYPEAISILCNYARDYTEIVKVSFMTSSFDYNRLYQEYKSYDEQSNTGGLTATLKFTYMERGGNATILDPPPFKRTYRVYIPNARDRGRSMQDIKGRTEINESMTVQLVDPVVYDNRVVKIFGNYKGQTIQKMIYMATALFKIERIFLHPPDNVMEFSYVNIPPAKSLKDFYDYLHEYKGVYYEGFGYFITDSTLYVYPKYKIPSTSENIALIYLSDVGAYAGLSSYHTYQGDKTIEIVLSGMPKTHDLSTMASENHGNSFTIFRASEVLDGVVDVVDGVHKYLETASLMISSERNKTSVPSKTNITHGGTTDNIYAVTSEIAKYENELIVGEWLQAIPYSIKPYHRIKYYYPNGEQMQFVEGQIYGVGYESNRGQMNGNNLPTFTFVGKLSFLTKPSKMKDVG